MKSNVDNLKALFEERCRSVVEGVVANDIESDMDEMVADFEAELLEDTDDLEVEGINAGVTIAMPADDEIVSFDETGIPLSKFGHQVWIFLDKQNRQLPIPFGQASGTTKVNFADPLATAYTDLQKLMVYSSLPRNNRQAKPFSATTLFSQNQINLVLLEWLYSCGFLLGQTRESLQTLGSLCPELFAKEVNRRIDAGDGISQTTSMLAALRRLCKMSQSVYCPPEFKLSFGYRDAVNSNLARKAARYVADKMGRWKAIEFDDLEPMLRRAKAYVDCFYTDIQWLIDQYADMRRERDASSMNKTEYFYIDTSRNRKHIFDAVISRRFAIDPETHSAWWDIEVLNTPDHRYDYIPTEQIRVRLKRCAGACIFILLFFTGMRSKELKTIKTTWLKVNGQPLDEKSRAVAQVDAAGSNAVFDLTRMISKIDGNQIIGRPHEVPIPYIAARAFAILVDMLSASRRQSQCDTLIPPRGIRTIYFADDDVAELSTSHSMSNPHVSCLRDFCNDAGVDMQSPHRCRKSLATLLINEDPSSLDVIRYLLGHKSIVMTYRYIMALPGINREVLSYMMEKETDAIISLIGDGIEGKLAGGGGNRALDAIQRNVESFKGRNLETTVSLLVTSLETSGFIINRTPAAWCLRLHGRVPRTAPCLPEFIQNAIAAGDIVDAHDIHPVPEHCVPWKCGDAGHSTKDLPAARRNQRYAGDKSSSAKTANARALYSEQASYWQEVVGQLENGRTDIVGLQLLNLFDGGRE